MQRIPVLVTLDFTDEQITTLQQVSDRLQIRQVPTRTQEGVAAALDDYPDTVILYTTVVPEAWSPDWALRWIQLHWAGADHLDFENIPAHIRITTASGVHTTVVAEHTLALLLGLRRRVYLMVAYQRRGEWPRHRWAKFARPVLRGQTIGILGYGAIGREIARLAQSFGMRVLAFKRDPQQHVFEGFRSSDTIGDPEGTIPAAYYGPEELPTLLAESDVVVNVLPATHATDRLIDAEALAAMKSGALFINVGRGTTVDEAALVDALADGHLAGAALDVFTEEPLPADSPLFDCENLIISPHVGGMFPGYDDTCVALFRENLERFLTDRPLLNEIDRSLGY